MPFCLKLKGLVEIIGEKGKTEFVNVLKMVS